VKAGQATHNCGVFSKSLVAVKLDKVFKQTLDQIERVGTVSMSRELHAFECRSLLNWLRLWG
jgi:hypothetical protein